MAFSDLRQLITALEEMNELRVVRGADWDLEIGTISELDYEHDGPALLFDEIVAYPAGYRVLTNAVDTLPRALLSVGLPTDLDVDSALTAWDTLLANYEPVPPVEVKDGPVFENVFTGSDVDLWKFPTPRWHEHDGGRYIGTGCAVFLRDPDTGYLNFGTYRLMVQDAHTAGLYITPNKTGAIIRNKYWAAGKSCPVAVTFGSEMTIFLAAAHYLGEKHRLPKYELIGHVRREPVEVVREEITGFPIPATAEIVIAGELPPPAVEARPEGPFGEWTGYYGSDQRPEPIIRVQALYHRDDPIILGMPPMKYRRATSHFGIPSRARNEIERLRKAGVEDVIDVWPLAVPGVMVVRIRQRYPGHAMKAGMAASGEYMGRFVVVVDEDIDARDAEQVLWAVGTRCDPETTITILKGCQSSVLDPRIPPDRKARGDLTSSRAIINACKPYEWIKEFPVTNVASPELRRRTLEKWHDLFEGSRSEKQPAPLKA
jgi:UbiD family decarboxylase